MERREEKNENTRSARVINPRLLTGASHFSTPRLATCGAPQWNTTHCVPERTPPPTANYSEHRVCVCVCLCVCVLVKKGETTGTKALLPLLHRYSASLNTDQSISRVTLLQTQLLAYCMHTHNLRKRGRREGTYIFFFFLEEEETWG